MVKITFVRHAESVDNIKHVWGGHKDANLTNHGMKDESARIYSPTGSTYTDLTLQQAEALAKSFSTLKLTAIYTSDLTRAQLTAKAIQTAQNPSHSSITRGSSTTESSSSSSSSPPPSSSPSHIPTSTRAVQLHTTELLREQYFGAAEGQPYNIKRNASLTMPQHFAKGLFPPLFNRNHRFPGGETRNEVRARAERFLEEVVMPYVRAEESQCDLFDDEEREGGDLEGDVVGGGVRERVRSLRSQMHIVVVSHGIMLVELITLLALKDTARMASREKEIRNNVKGMLNTGWTRIEFGYERPFRGHGVSGEGEEGKDPTERTKQTAKSFEVKFLNINVAPHLNNLKRQKGGISRLAHDPKQKDIRAFFSR